MDTFVLTFRIGIIIIFTCVMGKCIYDALTDFSEGPIGTRDSVSYAENAFFPAVTLCPYKGYTMISKNKSILTWNKNFTFVEALDRAVRPLIIKSNFMSWYAYVKGIIIKYSSCITPYLGMSQTPP